MILTGLDKRISEKEMRAALCFFPRLIGLFALLSASTLSAADHTGKPTRAVVFENFEPHAHSRLMSRLMKQPHLSTVARAGVAGSAALRATYVGYPRGSERIAFNYPLGERGLAYTLSFDVRFCRNFQFVRGGKLHGLGPAHPVTGGNQGAPDSWSARLMFKGDGGLSTYVYHQGQKGRYGEGVSAKGFRFKPGKYYAIDFQVKLNSPSHASNGSVTVYVDGRRVISHKRIQFRSAATRNSQLSTLLFSTFHGGNGPEWAPRAANGAYTSVCADFDNLIISRGLTK